MTYEEFYEGLVKFKKEEKEFENDPVEETRNYLKDRLNNSSLSLNKKRIIWTLINSLDKKADCGE